MDSNDDFRREQVARALCKREGMDPDSLMLGNPLWWTYLADAEALLALIDQEPPDEPLV